MCREIVDVLTRQPYNLCLQDVDTGAPMNITARTREARK